VRRRGGLGVADAMHVRVFTTEPDGAGQGLQSFRWVHKRLFASGQERARFVHPLARARMKIRKHESAHLASGRLPLLLLLLLLLMMMMMMKLVLCACINVIVNYASILAFACA